MYAQSLIQVRIDKSLKDDVSEIFASLGLDVSTAVRMFFQRCHAVKGIPFALTLADTTQEKVVPKPRLGIAKGKWKFPKDWEKLDREMDKEIERDFYADSACAHGRRSAVAPSRSI